jgi:signal transduction histidine kinase/ActR/RegA family two-component response regulator
LLYSPLPADTVDVQKFGLVKLRNYALAVAAFVLCQAVFSAELPTYATLPTYTSAASVREMTAAEARLHYPVNLRATVLVSLPFWHMFMAQEGKTGICVTTGSMARPDLKPGDTVNIKGQTVSGDFAPIISTTGEASDVQITGNAALPPAKPVTLEQLSSGLEDSQWIETEGTVRGIFTRKSRLMLIVGSASTRTEVLVTGGSEEEARSLVGAKIRLRGTAAGVFNQKHRMIGVSLYASGLDEIKVLSPAPKDPFSIPPTTIQDVARYSPGWNPDQRVHIKGTLSAQWPGKAIFVTDGVQSIEVLTETAQAFQPGDRLDIVAFPATDQNSYNLGDAEIRLLGHGTPPPAKVISSQQALSGDFDQDLVQIDGLLISSQITPNEATLLLKSSDQIFMAILPGLPGLSFAEALRDGSTVRLTGIFSIDDGGSNRPHRPVKSFRIVLRSASDFQVLHQRSWWTAAHAISAICLLLASVFGISAWVAALRRRVKLQTRVIQQQLEEAQVLTERAEAANRTKSEFLANMSHDIRTPMNGIIGMTDFVLQSDLTGDQQECLEVVRSSADSLLNLINDILDFSKIEAGKLDIESVRFNLRDCLNETTRMLSFRAAEKGLELSCTVHPSIPEMVTGDPSRLRQILINLAGNAIKFTQAGLVSIEVSMEAADCQEDGHLHFVVRDTGIGIKPEQQRSIFEPFVQSDSSINRRYGGTGLGLSICARLVQLMGGKIWVVSQPGIGSRFHFTAHLPAAAPSAVPEKAAAARAEDASSDGLRILVAEDNAVNQKIITRVLEKEGHTVILAWNGREALEILDRQPVDLIIMDVHMPELDGLQTAAQIRSRESGTSLYRPIIAATACAMKGDREKCLAAGMDAYITKPIQAKQLLQVIDSIVARNPGRMLMQV